LVLKRLKGIPYALQLLDVVRIGRTHTGLVFPYTNNTYYREAFPLLSAQDVREYTRRTLVALAGAHERGVVHMDIKPINIFYDFYSGELQLGDWGLSFFYNRSTHHSWQTMTLYWKAPEVLFGARDYSYAVDMWSVGVTFAGMLTGKFHFFEGRSAYALASSWIDFLGVDMFDAFIAKYQFSLRRDWMRNYVHRRPAAQWVDLIRPENRHMISAEALDLAKRMLQLDPAVRITARDALAHPYFRSDQVIVDGRRRCIVPLILIHIYRQFIWKMTKLEIEQISLKTLKSMFVLVNMFHLILMKVFYNEESLFVCLFDFNMYKKCGLDFIAWSGQVRKKGL
jgi:casein kinase II subunit alpha